MISIGEVFAPKVPLIQFIIRRILPANTSVSKQSGFWRVLDSPVSRNVCVFLGEILKNVCESVKLAHKKYQTMVLKWFPLLPRPKDPLSEMPPTWLWRLQRMSWNGASKTWSQFATQILNKPQKLEQSVPSQDWSLRLESLWSFETIQFH